jgi:ribose transport system permease protein
MLLLVTTPQGGRAPADASGAGGSFGGTVIASPAILPETPPPPAGNVVQVGRSPSHMSLGHRVGDLSLRGSLIFVLAALIIVFGALNGGTFLSTSNFTEIANAQVLTGLLAIGVAVVLIAGELDLSVAAVMGTVGATVALLLTKGMNPIAAACIGLAIAGAIGVANGVLVGYFRINSIIVTLGSASIATGIGLAIVGPDTVAAFPNSFVNFFTNTAGGLETCFFMLLVVVVVAAFLLQFTPMGRRLFFMGQNVHAAHLLGIRVRRIKLGSFIIASLLAGFAGIVLASQSDSASVVETTSYLLPAYAAAFLSTTAITPARFNAVGALIATIILGTVDTGLNELAVPDWTTYAFDGGLLIIALGLFTLLKTTRERASIAKSAEAATGSGTRAESVADPAPA